MERRDRPREQALAILCEAEGGAFADPLLEGARRDFDSRDSAFILELVYGVLRNRSLLDWTLDRFSTRPVSATDARTRNLLRLGAYQILRLDRIPLHSAVDTTTELAKRHGKKPGYVNGLLRNLARNRSALPLPADDDPVIRLAATYSHPAWLVRRWHSRFGPDRTEEILRQNNLPAPLTIRTNVLRTTRAGLMASLAAEGAEVRETRYSPAGITVLASPGIRNLSAYQQGWFFVQDEAAQLVPLMLAPAPGETVLDACAAPGGKATHLAELMQDRGSVVALESDERRIGRIRENSGRLGLTALRPLIGDAAAFSKGEFDKVLIDAPCSGLGVLRRHPDGRWTKQEGTVRDRAVLQAEILENCSRLARPGGALVYATCTTEPEENEDIVGSFLSRHAGFTLDDPRALLPSAATPLVGDDLFFRTFPGDGGMDGFFAARLIRPA